ncbi:hypothetical protein [Mycobacteroides abscessus]|uniref:hypothetical protein n=1 Tax=Mycobacteroides abscessus TaxID=36809 RepID=UPI000381A678|nr:hypothetical protein [Mycobacteroides abscessus]
MSTPAFAHQLLAVEISAAESATLLEIATQPSKMIGATSVGTAVARRCRQLARKGLARYVNSVEGGWPAGMWAAYPTCNGLNAMWRHAGDTHVDRCGAPWNPDGTCSGCRTRRPLDLPAYEQYLAALTIPDRQAELRTSALWCIEHGYIRRIDVTIQKTCPFKGSSIHDGGLDRIGCIHLAV